MPIPREIRRLYYGVDWYRTVRPAAMERAENRCQRCGLPQGSVGYRTRGLFHPVPVRRRRGQKGLVRIFLQVAHLNHVHGDDRPENLQAMCPRCHFLHDREKHKVTREVRKDQARPLLAEGAAV
jgi:ribosomal protein S27AE